MRVGLIADTHYPERCPVLPPRLFETLQGVDLILHAGDVGDLALLDDLALIAPVVAVHGNDETHEAQSVLPERVLLHVAGRRVLLTHTHQVERADDWPTALEYRRRLAASAGADILVFGHNHVPLAASVDGVLLLNPGIVGHGHVVLRSRPRSVAVLELSGGEASVVHIDVETGAPFEPAILPGEDYWQTFGRMNESLLAHGIGADWRTFWQTLRDVSHQPTWTALLTLAQRCWTGESDAVSEPDVLDALRRDGTVDPATLRRFAAALESMRCKPPTQSAARLGG